MSEHDQQSAFASWVMFERLQTPELWCGFAIPNGGLRSKATASKLKAEGVLAGVWDWHLAVPNSDYSGLWIEFKYGSNDLTEEQEKFRDNVLKYSNPLFFTCWDWRDAAFEVLKYLGKADRMFAWDFLREKRKVS